MTENVLEVQVRAPEELREGRKATQVVPEALSLVVSLGTPLLDELADPEVPAEGDGARDSHEIWEEALDEAVYLIVHPEVVGLVDQRPGVGVKDHNGTAMVVGVSRCEGDVHDRMIGAIEGQGATDLFTVFDQTAHRLDECVARILERGGQAFDERLRQARLSTVKLLRHAGKCLPAFLFREQSGKRGTQRIVDHLQRDHAVVGAAGHEIDFAPQARFQLLEHLVRKHRCLRQALDAHELGGNERPKHHQTP